MSLVERALGKLRQANTAASAAQGASPVLQQARPAALQLRATEVEFVPEADSGKRIEIDRDDLRATGYLPESVQERLFAAQYNQIKRTLIQKALEGSEDGAGSRRLIMIASALPGDGKTFTSINLALSIARERDLSVVLVDADVAKPHVSKIFGIQKERGLLDALIDHTLDVRSLLINTNLPGLKLLSAGQLQEGAAELLASDRMREVVAQLVNNDPRRIVLLDSPPLLVSSESRALIPNVGQAVLVARAGKTPSKAVLDAVAKFSEDLPVGLVLNQGRIGITESYFGYGYGYGDESSSDLP